MTVDFNELLGKVLDEAIKPEKKYSLLEEIADAVESARLSMLVSRKNLEDTFPNFMKCFVVFSTRQTRLLKESRFETIHVTSAYFNHFIGPEYYQMTNWEREPLATDLLRFTFTAEVRRDRIAELNDSGGPFRVSGRKDNRCGFREGEFHHLCLFDSDEELA